MPYTTKYNFVNLCEELRTEIQGYSKEPTNIYDEWCNSIKPEYEGYNIFNDQHTCKQVISFLRVYFDNLDDPHICKSYEDESKNIILEKSAKLTELYDTFNNNSNKFDCDCAKKCSVLYIKYVEECHGDYDYDFCSELQSFKNKYDNNMKSIGTCEGAPNILPSALKHDLHVIIIIPMIILTVLSFLVFALYKFTPIGSRITNRKRRKNVFFEKQSYRTNTLLPTSGGTRRTEQNAPYNIAYNSTTYS
ncbi:PIR protein [Plasmodium vivax]|uniref:VIR protein n=1 Tax=Plasmodium vivax TaxID=5855 RepID=A0A565A4H0_PLAVI|nr:PIR protein [Plasmodium vivax]